MNYKHTVKKIGLVSAAVAFILGAVLVIGPAQDAEALSANVIRAVSPNGSVIFAGRGGSRRESRNDDDDKPEKKPKKSENNNDDDDRREGENSYARRSRTGDCQNVGGRCVVFSSNSCNNFYINGRHYGGSRSCQILGRDCPPADDGTTPTEGDPNDPNNPGGGPGGDPIPEPRGVIRVARIIRDLNGQEIGQEEVTELRRECTPGVDCPADELGPILRHCVVTPAYSAKNTNTCPFFWVAGTQNDSSSITCKLVGPTGAEVDVPTDPLTGGYTNGYPIPVGRSVLKCVRKTQMTEEYVTDEEVAVVTQDEEGYDVVTLEVISSTSTDVWEKEDLQEHVVECKQNPAVREI